MSRWPFVQVICRPVAALARKGFRISGLTLLLVVGLGVNVTASAPSWNWIAGQVTPSGWFITRGMGTVTIAKRELRAELFDGDNGTLLRKTIKGEVTGNRIKATVITKDSDVRPEQMTGTYSRRVYGQQEFEAIIIHDQWGFVAITRTLPRP